MVQVKLDCSSSSYILHELLHEFHFDQWPTWCAICITVSVSVVTLLFMYEYSRVVPALIEDIINVVGVLYVLIDYL